VTRLCGATSDADPADWAPAHVNSASSGGGHNSGYAELGITGRTGYSPAVTGGGKTAATLMSLCTTCKDLGIDPFAYLRDVLDRVSTHPHRRIDELLPDRWKPLEAADPGGRKG
jgi:IS66 C-terminal element